MATEAAVGRVSTKTARVPETSVACPVCHPFCCHVGHAGLYFLLAMCLFPRAGYRGVWGKLTAGLRVLGLAAPSGKALRDLRRRIGIRR